MIVVKLQGGLGNQMFGYAFARAVSTTLDVPYALDTTDLNRGEGVTRRRYALDCFATKPRMLTANESLRFRFGIQHPLMSRLGHSLGIGSIAAHHVVQANPTEYLTIDPSWAARDTYFEGLWQSPEYAQAIESVLRNDFTFKTELSSEAQSYAREIAAGESLAIQVRRGDYASHPKVQSVLWLTDENYFRRAVARVENEKHVTQLFVFSDDVPWCRDHITTNLPTTFIPATMSDVDSLCLLSLCKHAIISNSSFGWWGAWLNANPNKIVIAPQKWFKRDGDSQAIAPSSWMRL
jgi:hypothetical protein